ncbi:NADP-dependent 3-hydroxy acid dehydrogenase YdfG [Nocardia amikacinitolerans]|nr:NADP-dependent 3-hydroxy acid dehydrogenase YdfG [Nocardia amikacinitolerans]
MHIVATTDVHSGHVLEAPPWLASQSMSSVRDTVVAITGAANGIGAATARLLVAKGAKVVLIDIDTAALYALADELGAEVALAVAGDVTLLDAMQQAVDLAVERFGGIDFVIANAGIASYGSVLHTDPDAFARVLDINLLGVFHTVRAALPAVIERRGYILVVSSIGAFAAMPGLAAYNASKAGAEHFVNCLRLEVEQVGVGVGSAHMSWIDTPMVRDAKADLSTFRQILEMLPGPMRNTLSAEECATAFVRSLEQRKRHVYVPSWVAWVGRLRSLVNSDITAMALRRHIPGLLTRMDDEVSHLGRATSLRIVNATKR